MVRHNNEVPNQHFHKVCQQDHIRTWFNQPARKTRRRAARQAKAAKMAPRPTAGLLRPVVHPSTVKCNYKLRQGRGFTFAELKEAGINRKEARSIGIAVDHRRRNRSTESLQMNAQRLKEFKSKLIVFPRKRGKPKTGDADAAELDKAEQLKGPLLPMPSLGSAAAEPMAITAEMKEVEAFHTIRMARADYRLFGVRQKNRLAKEEKEK
jgi:large subunit ribosomal protein L13e